MKKEHIISMVHPGSIAEEMEIEAGDVLLEIDGQEIEDILDYRFYTEDEQLTVLIRKPDGEEWELEIEKEYEEDLGMEFDSGLMDDYKSCSNHCIFCFIDQMPPGMRETLYFKDDDARLSFLQGNYVTLTNMKQKDMDRIVRYHMSPINVSVHTTNPELRCKMLHNRFAGEALKKIDFFYENNIEMNGQIVLCKGYNDGIELDRTLKDLMKYCPVMQSVSVVPVGLTKYRDGLCPLESFSKEDALKAIRQIEAVQERCMELYGIRFVHPSDEFYLLAELPMPEEEQYDGYVQLENGVGMMRLLYEESRAALQTAMDVLPDPAEVASSLTIATGRLAAPLLEKISDLIMADFPKVKIRVIPVRNDFFGEKITVSGLITGADLKNQLFGNITGDRLLIPMNMLRSGETVFLDDVTVAELEDYLQCEVIPVQTDGYELVNEILGTSLIPDEGTDFRPYELEEL